MTQQPSSDGLLVDHNEPPNNTVGREVDHSSPLTPVQASNLLVDINEPPATLQAIEPLKNSQLEESVSSLPIDKSEPPVEELAEEKAIAGEPEEEAVEEEPAASEPPEEEAAVVAASKPLAQKHLLKPLTSLGLGKRLNRNLSSISRAKDKGNPYLRRWSKGLDPDGIAWEFRKGEPRSAQFHPLA